MEDAGEAEDLFDEVWKLTSKFYLDRSFGGNDWEKVRGRGRGALRAAAATARFPSCFA